MSVDEIMKTIKATYSANRTTYNKYYTQRQDTDKQLIECCKGSRLTENYYRDLRSNLLDVRSACNMKLEEITKSVKEALESILEVAKKEFRNFNAKDIDAATVNLLNTDILSIEELEELAKDFNTNKTMQRVIAKAMQRKAGNAPSDRVKDEIAMMSISTNKILESVMQVAAATYNALGGYKALDTRESAYNRSNNDGADLATELQKSYFNSVDPIIRHALAVEIMENQPTASSAEILEEIENNAFYKQIQEESRKESDAIAAAKADAENKRKERMQNFHDKIYFNSVDPIRENQPTASSAEILEESRKESGIEE